jgi:SMC interacting uncharacterized protein involved in chromosome segregation
MSRMFRTARTANIWVGLGTAVAVSVIAPTIGKMVKPYAINGVKNIKNMMNLYQKPTELFHSWQDTQDGVNIDDNNYMTYNEESIENLIHTVNQLKEETVKSNEQLAHLQNELDEMRSKLQY